MKKISKKQLKAILNKLTFFDCQDYEIIKGSLIKIRLRSDKKGDSGLYDFENQSYLEMEHRLEKLFCFMLKYIFKKELIIKPSNGNSWFTPPKKKVYLKNNNYKKIIEFVNKNKIPNYFEGAFLLKKKDIDLDFLCLIIKMNIRGQCDFDFIFDRNLVICINHHMQYFLFCKDSNYVNSFLENIASNKLFIIE